MYTIKIDNPEELNVVEKSLHRYKEKIQRIQQAKDFLENKKFKHGTFVQKTVRGHFDNVFNVPADNVGKIVDWDFENNYYRVYFSKSQPYQGVGEDMLTEYSGDVSDDVKNANPLEPVSFLDVEL